MTPSIVGWQCQQYLELDCEPLERSQSLPSSSSIKNLHFKIISLMGKEDGRKIGNGKPGTLGPLNEIPA